MGGRKQSYVHDRTSKQDEASCQSVSRAIRGSFARLVTANDGGDVTSWWHVVRNCVSRDYYGDVSGVRGKLGRFVGEPLNQWSCGYEHGREHEMAKIRGMYHVVRVM